MSSNLDTSNLDTSNLVQINSSNISVELQHKCCIQAENNLLRNTIQCQTAEIGKIIQERDAYKVLYEDLLNLIYVNTSNV